MGERHVVPNRGHGGWKVIGSSTGATEQQADTQAEAVEQAIAELAHDGGEVLVHGLDGAVQEKRVVHPRQR
ncbi:uncharacterized protein DUF2188 [Saccharopolyspora erythraea NRRL 2338]|uniref:Uncharacterized protein n=2 Tax=Saccharopolyspora erythraea TaxID=1836 RepID=A4FL48_SACEN|nr:DUF2188 domain-containing protein [Saccharopolyspora erythraea]EQD83747.1 hypothetical protein N599_23640 [Saccharopolyspora erythraea D]PFG98413.1 uncharacterized protein DUF2188 [Saccharopolyspora erythraea NRRL 2338]QRK88481.1 DUF2188 domain-containing protein [Saccharopolyspora erythraea]CAM04773.1 hypothetical protein SACE_5587 [Saccharopolyspora erythraea NRRL 2338]